jgi:hypothetical protein
MGLKSSAWYSFSWTDGYTPGPGPNSAGYYRHWGQGVMSDPNENALCVVGDYSLSYAIPLLTPAASGWGWNDVDCNQLLPYGCKFPQCERGCRAGGLPPVPAVLIARPHPAGCGCLAMSPLSGPFGVQRS